MRSWVVKSAIILSITAFLAGCGGSSSSSKTNSTVAQVALSPASISVVAGEVSSLSVAVLNPNGTAVSNPVPTVTFNSSNPNLVTVKGDGTVCGGVWDSSFIVCKGTDSSGNPLVGTATITATAGGVSSAPIQVAVHPVVTSITVDPVAGCSSNKQTHQFVAHACSSQVLPHDTTGPCAPNAKEISNLIGSFTWTQSQANVASVDANGLATALNPGLTGVIANVGTVASPAVPFRSCMPVKITLHLNGDPAESVTLAVSATDTVQADMIDENNVTTASAPVSIVSNNTEVATVSANTLTGQSFGGAGLLAVCAPPSCGAGLNTLIYSNLFSVTSPGGSGPTMVYATSSFAPPTASPTPTILPIDTSKTPPAAGTAINMPCPVACAVPNSMVFQPSGAKAFLGTSQGLASLDTTTNTVTLLDPFVGKVLAVSPDGNTVIESNAANDPGTGTPIEPIGANQRVVILTGATGTGSTQTLAVQGANAAAFTGDSSKAFISTNNGTGNVYVFSTFATFQTVNVAGSSADITTLASGPFTFLANSAGLEVLGTCNNVQQPSANNPPIHAGPLQFIQSFKNADVFVGMDTTGVDIETATVTALSPPTVISPANCTPNVTYSNQFVDFGLGPITARQLLVGTNVSSHIAVLPVGIPKVLAAIAGNAGGGVIPLAAGATEALSGGMTLDGLTLWVGVAGTNNVDRINLLTATDDLQIATTFKKSDGTAAPPNIVAVKPK